MARKPRIHSLGAICHLMQRGNARQDIFSDDQDRYQLNTAELCAPGKAQPAAEARAVAALLVRNADSLSLSELAGFLNRDLSGLSQAALRIGRRAGTDDLLRRKLDRVSEKLGISVYQA